MDGTHTRDSADFSAEGFRLRAGRQSGDLPAEGFGDHRLNPGLGAILRANAKRPAAVLIAIVDSGLDARVLLTQRTANLRTHSGQIAFPGGTVDASDASPVAAALREANEEIGLSPAMVTPVGELPEYVTGSGFRITPVLAVVDPAHALTPNPHEVEAVFDVPLSFLMNADNHRIESRIWQGKERFYYTMPYRERFIWGVTAGIIRTLYERLYR
jgi:8-oxo-dGTP pyrophosphatase MutT (NUDIX family)